MALIDFILRFSDSQAVTTSANSSSIDLGAARDLVPGRELRINITLGTLLASSGAATVDAIAYTTSQPLTILGGTAITCTSATPCVATLTAHGMSVGTEVFLGGTAPTGLATATVYYVSNVTANTFTFSTTYANAILGTALASSSTGTSVTLSPFVVQVASTGALGYATWNLALTQGSYTTLAPRIKGQIGSTGNTKVGSETIPRGRYLTILYSVGTAALTGGTFIADLVMDSADGRKFYPTGVSIT